MKILIVDDEPLIRQRLRETIAWKKIGCELCGEAENGLEAIEATYQLKPDIMITDIRMPGLTGLELIYKLKPDFPNMKFILLTGYSDFQYAQTAIKLGAFDFVLKPTDEDEILEIVNKAKSAILEEREKKLASENISIQQIGSNDGLKEMAFLNLIESNTAILESNVNIRNFIKVFEGRFCILSIEIDNFDWLEEKLINGRQADFKKNVVKNIIEQDFNFIKDVICLNKQSSLILFLLFSKTVPASKLNTCCQEVASNLSSKIYKNFGFTISIGISRVYNDIANINEAYEESSKALEFRFYKESTAIININEVPLEKDFPSSFYYSSYKNIISKVILCDKIETKSEITKFFKDIQSNKCKNVLYIKTVILQLLHLTIYNLKDNYPNIEDLNKDFDIDKIVLRCNTLSDVQVKIFDFYEHLIEFILPEAVSEKKGCTGNFIVLEVISYIKNNIAEDISLNSAARIVYMSPSYLCRLIKKETGKNFTDFVLEYRIEKAKELLKDFHFKTYEIGVKVGFSYSRNFSVKFKQQVGMTPKEYRNSILQEHI